MHNIKQYIYRYPIGNTDMQYRYTYTNAQIQRYRYPATMQEYDQTASMV